MPVFRKGSVFVLVLSVFVSAFAAFALVAAPAGARQDPPLKLKGAPEPDSVATFKARGSIGGVHVTGVKPKTNLLLVNKANGIVARGKTDRFGSKVFFEQKPGPGYRVFSVRGGKVAATSKFRVLKAGDNPPASFYAAKTLNKGLNYVTMRDGIEIAMTVRPPAGKSLDEGPFPTCLLYTSPSPRDS